MSSLTTFYVRRGDKKEAGCRRFLENCPHSYFQQTLEWRGVIESLGKDESVFIVARKGNEIVGVLPTYIFRSPYGNILNSVPQAGPLGGVVLKEAAKRAQEQVFRKLMSSLEDLAREIRCAAATIISSPFWPDHNLYRKLFKPHYELGNYTLFIDLTKPQKTNSHFRNNLKRMLRRAQENSLSVIESTNKKDVLAWYSLHRSRHLLLDLEPLPKDLIISSLENMVKKDKGKFFFVKDGKGKIVTGCLVLYHNIVLDTYMLSGSKESYKNGAVYLLINHVINWAKKRNFQYFNWESSKPRGGGPYNFKLQWGSAEAPYYFFTKLYQPPDSLISLGLARIKKAYKWHFVLPHSLFDS